MKNILYAFTKGTEHGFDDRTGRTKNQTMSMGTYIGDPLRVNMQISADQEADQEAYEPK